MGIEITNENTLTIIDMSKPIMTHAQARMRIQNCIDWLIEHAESEHEVQAICMDSRNIDEDKILHKIYGLTMCYESGMVNIPDSWDDDNLWDKCLYATEFYIWNGKIPEDL